MEFGVTMEKHLKTIIPMMDLVNILFGVCLKTRMETYGLEHETADYTATMEKHLKSFQNNLSRIESMAAANSGLAKVAVQHSADTFLVNQTLVLRINFVVKIATFAKPQNVMSNQIGN